MPKMPDFSKFDLQGIVNSIKTIINPEGGAPNVTEGDPIGAKIVQISTLLQTTANAQAQAGKDLTKINTLLNDLYQDLEAFRKLEVELRQKQQAQSSAAPPFSNVVETPAETKTSDQSDQSDQEEHLSPVDKPQSKENE